MTSPIDTAPDYILNLPPYVPGRPAAQVQRELGIAEVCMMASNENPLGASPLAVAAMQQALAQAALYPDNDGFELKAALQRRFGLAPERVLVGSGSSELIDLAARSFMRAGDEAVFSDYAFIAYPRAVRLVNGVAVRVPARGLGHDLQAMAAAITERTRLVFVANPNNPTGTRLGAEELHAFLRQVPAQVAVLLDEAYVEYQAPEERIDSFALVDEFANLIVSRTFSKAYGLAGLRVGYAAAQPALVELMNRSRPPFNVNSLALCAATAALADEAFLARTYQVNREGMRQLQDGFERLGLPYEPSWGNFLAVDFGGRPIGAAEVSQRLLQAGFSVRPLAPYGLPKHLRITIGRPEQNAAFLLALGKILGAA